jgi:CspA family cold shock protein
LVGVRDFLDFAPVVASGVDVRRSGPLGWSQANAHRRIAAMPNGTIARLLIDKGFGFIRDEGGIEHFFHRSSVRGAVFELLREGQRVEFTPEESTKGPRAGDVRLLEG